MQYSGGAPVGEVDAADRKALELLPDEPKFARESGAYGRRGGEQVTKMAEESPRIRVRVAGAPGVDYDRSPVTFGLPFADGMLERGAPIRLLDSGGAVLPVQARCLATWKPDRRFVKWLLVDTVASWREAARRSWRSSVPVLLRTRCRIGNGSGSANKDGSLCLDTGALRLRLPRAAAPSQAPPGFLTSCQVRGPEGWRSCSAGAAPACT